MGSMIGPPSANKVNAVLLGPPKLGAQGGGQQLTACDVMPIERFMGSDVM